MNTADDALSVAERLRLGRLIFDGAEIAAVADRCGFSSGQVEAAWHYCQRALSEHFAAAGNSDFRMLSGEELRGRGIDCLRLLLDWREAALVDARWQNALQKGVNRDEENPAADSIDEDD